MNKKAFTLIELLVVIAIIALLVSILMPSLKTAKDMARSAVCMSNQKNILLGFSLYAAEENGDLPPDWVWTDGRDYPSDYTPNGTGTDIITYQNVSSRGAKWFIDQAGIWDGPVAGSEYRRVPDFCFCTTGYRFPETGDMKRWHDDELYSLGIPLTLPRNVADSANSSAEPFVMDSVVGGALNSDTPIAIVDRAFKAGRSYWASIRHLEKGNIGFGDGHVESMSGNKIYDLGFDAVSVDGSEIINFD